MHLRRVPDRSDPDAEGCWIVFGIVGAMGDGPEPAQPRWELVAVAKASYLGNSEETHRGAMRHLIVGSVLVLVVAGCTGGSTGNDADSTAATRGSPISAVDAADPGFPLTYSGPPATVDLLTEGTLHIDPASQCVTLALRWTEPPDDIRVVLAVPEGSTIDLTDEANPTLVMEGCRPLVDGDHVQFGGMGSPLEREALEEYVGSAYFERCGATDMYLAGACAHSSRR